MTYINSDEHGPHVVHLVWEFQVVEITSHLAVDLLENVGRLGEVETSSVSGCDHLRGDLVELVQLLMLRVKRLISEDHEQHLREAVRIA